MVRKEVTSVNHRYIPEEQTNMELKTARNIVCNKKCLRNKIQANNILQPFSHHNIFVMISLLFIALPIFGNTEASSSQQKIEIQINEITFNETEFHLKESWMKMMREYFNEQNQDFKMNNRKYESFLNMEKPTFNEDQATTDSPSEETTMSWLQFMEEDAIESYDDSNKTKIQRYKRDTGDSSGSGSESTTTESDFTETTSTEEGSGATTTYTSIVETTTHRVTDTTTFHETTPNESSGFDTTTTENTSPYQTSSPADRQTTTEITTSNVATTFSGDETTTFESATTQTVNDETTNSEAEHTTVYSTVETSTANIETTQSVTQTLEMSTSKTETQSTVTVEYTTSSNLDQTTSAESTESDTISTIITNSDETTTQFIPIETTTTDVTGTISTTIPHDDETATSSGPIESTTAKVSGTISTTKPYDDETTTSLGPIESTTAKLSGIISTTQPYDDETTTSLGPIESTTAKVSGIISTTQPYDDETTTLLGPIESTTAKVSGTISTTQPHDDETTTSLGPIESTTAKVSGTISTTQPHDDETTTSLGPIESTTAKLSGTISTTQSYDDETTATSAPIETSTAGESGPNSTTLSNAEESTTVNDTETEAETSTSITEVTTEPSSDQCTIDPDSCPINQYCVQTSSIKKCECKPGFVANSDGQCSEPVKQFGGQLHVDVDYNKSLDDPNSDYYKEQERIYINTLKLAYQNEEWYISVTIIAFRRGSTVAQYELTTKADNTVNSTIVQKSFEEFLSNDTYFPGDCNCSSVDCNTRGLDLNGKIIANDSCKDAATITDLVCTQDSVSQYCDDTSSLCVATLDGETNCDCKGGFVPNPDTDNSCIRQICEYGINSGCNAPFGQCEKTTDSVGMCSCMWGFYGTNCREPWLFVFVVVMSGLVLIGLVVVLVCCIKRRRRSQSWKKSMTYYDDVIYENETKTVKQGRYKNLSEWDQDISSVAHVNPYDNSSAVSINDTHDRNGHSTTVSANVSAEMHDLRTVDTLQPTSKRSEMALGDGQDNPSYQEIADGFAESKTVGIPTYTHDQTKL